MNLSEHITSFVDRHQLITPQSTIVLGLSGGSDSVFLLHYLLTLRENRPFTLIVAHLNHGWRATAAHDEQFCRELAEHFGLPFIRHHGEQYASLVPKTGSREEEGRTMRRLFFESIASEWTHARIALAHHQDDQDETFFIRLVRGAGLQGLKGMTPRAGLYIRPLLCVRKQELLNYLEQHNIAFVYDSTNSDDVYLRNRIRHRVLPALRQCDQRFPASLQQALAHLAEADDFCTALADTTLQSITVSLDKMRWIDLSAFFKLHPFLQKQILIRWLREANVPFTPSQALFHEIMRFLQQPQGGKHSLSQHWFVQKQQQRATVISR